MTKNRSKIARERAGLSVGQAARHTGIDRDALILYEESDAAFAMANQPALASVYGVNLPWLRGEVPERDYAHVDRIKGADKLTSHDRDIIAEFVAAMPRGKR
jgi:transcriptional regulator with XRE-family HTH domain